MSSCPLKRKLLGPSWTMILTSTPSTQRTRATRRSTWTTPWRASSWCCQGRPPSTSSPTISPPAYLLSWAGSHSWLIQRWENKRSSYTAKCFCHFVVWQSSFHSSNFCVEGLNHPKENKITQGQRILSETFHKECSSKICSLSIRGSLNGIFF